MPGQDDDLRGNAPGYEIAQKLGQSEGMTRSAVAASSSAVHQRWPR
ncbi:hypothetical protein ACFQ9X_16420 [Catenulispora yoronensis]